MGGGVIPAAIGSRGLRSAHECPKGRPDGLASAASASANWGRYGYAAPIAATVSRRKKSAGATRRQRPCPACLSVLNAHCFEVGVPLTRPPATPPMSQVGAETRKRGSVTSPKPLRRRGISPARMHSDRNCGAARPTRCPHTLLLNWLRNIALLGVPPHPKRG